MAATDPTPRKRSGGKYPGAGRPALPASVPRDETILGVLEAEWRALDLSQSGALYRALRLIGEAAITGMLPAGYLAVLTDCVREARQVTAQALVSVRLEQVERSLAQLELARASVTPLSAQGAPSDLAYSDDAEEAVECDSPSSDSAN